MGTFYIVTDDETLENCTQWIKEKLGDGNRAIKVEAKRYVAKRSLDQNALFHKWCDEIAMWYRTSKGLQYFATGKPINKVTVKENFKLTYLGQEQKVCTNMKTGKVVTTSEIRHTSSLEVGEMSEFMRMIDQWAGFYGIELSHPEDSQYMVLNSEDGWIV